MKEDTGLVTADGKKIVSEVYDEEEPKIGDMVDQLRVNHPLQYLNMMSTNLEIMVREYNKTAFEHGEPIIAAVFVDSEEPEYNTYKGVLFPEGDVDAEDETISVREETGDGEGTGVDTERSEG